MDIPVLHPYPYLSPEVPRFSSGEFRSDYVGLLLLLLSRSVVSDSATLWAVACLSLCPWGFSRQENRSGLPFPSQSSGHIKLTIMAAVFKEVILFWEKTDK